MSFSAELLLRSEKSKTTQQIFNLLINRLGFSVLETSLKDRRGSIPATTLEGKTEEDILFTAAADLLDVRFPLAAFWIALLKFVILPLEWLEGKESEPASDFEDLRGNLLRNCFHMMANLKTSYLIRDHGSGTPKIDIDIHRKLKHDPSSHGFNDATKPICI